MKIKISVDFSDNTGGRYIKDGDFSGELFRETKLIPMIEDAIQKREQIEIDFDGGFGYSPSFLEETFGGLIRKGYSLSKLNKILKFISSEDISLIEDIRTYMHDEDKKHGK
ncbi:MAG: STAS-like domain-containing protein [Bacteroidales bacterium]|jgi:hypothetical protein|nr:STAS-like domain-containing protein [Bacteroidales bacterium]